MLKRIGYSLLFCIVWFIVSAILQKVSGNPNWLDFSAIGAIGGFFGMFNGYGIGKNEED